MLKSILFLTLLLINLNLTSQLVNTYSIEKIELPSDKSLLVSSVFGTSIINSKNPVNIKQIDSISLVYTTNKNNPNFNQEALNKKRIAKLIKAYPSLKEDSIHWSYISQTGYNTTTEAKQLYHGFIFHTKKEKPVEVVLENVIQEEITTKTTQLNKHDIITPYTLENNCNVFFSGLLVSDHADSDKTGTWNTWNSQFFVEDQYSESVKSGNYPDAEKAFPKANKATFDGIAINQGTRLIIFEEKNFKGDTIIDVEGPAIINNALYKKIYPDKKWRTRSYNKYYNERFPPSTRRWSKTNMTNWGLGSLKIICD